MKQSTKVLVLSIILIVLFGFSYISYEHIDNSYEQNEPIVIKNLKNTVDSLKTENEKLQKQLKEFTVVKEDSTNG